MGEGSSQMAHYTAKRKDRAHTSGTSRPTLEKKRRCGPFISLLRTVLLAKERGTADNPRTP